METEIRKSGKFISKGGNVMQQNLKEIVIQETSNYIWHKISCNYDFNRNIGCATSRADLYGTNV